MATLHDTDLRDFASDNHSGAHPQVLAAVAEANGGHQHSYGDDAYTARLREVFESMFGERIESFCVLTGTGGNVIALQSMLPRWGAVICADSAHINTDEAGAPERVGGIKLLPVPAEDGKLTTASIDREAWGWGFEHRAQPAVVSITQTTELGTCYSPEEIRGIADHVHGLGMHLHMDGARAANAAAALGLPLRTFTTEAGVDVLTLGGTKNGAIAAEAVIVLDPAAVEGITYLRKLNMQLASKMRFVSAQLLALFEGDLWLRNAGHANAMAARLRAAIESGLRDGSIRDVELTRPTASNAVFAALPSGAAERLRTEYNFYDWDHIRGEVRWMCSFDTTTQDVDAFVAALAVATNLR